jgi:tetratricopeptide (TPR) repeat protein
MELKMPRFVYVSILLLAVMVGCQCDPQRTHTSKPLIPVPSPVDLKVVWDTSPSPKQDPTLQCTPCHDKLVTAYKASAKYRTSSSVKTGSFHPPITAPRTIRTFTFSAAEGAPLIQSEILPAGGRKAMAVLQIGASGHSFAGFINQKLRLLPLTHDAAVNDWRLTSGYRGGIYDPFMTPIDQNCSVCHGLNDGTPSFFGIGCAECHGDLSQHAKDPEAPINNWLHSALSTSKGQGDLCGRCHTHVKARRFGYESQMRPLPSSAVDRAKDFRAYQRDTVLDEKIAGHQRRLNESKCFKNHGQTPRCSDCHAPHSAEDLTSKTRATCLSCHTDTKPCLDQRSAQSDLNCAQCHLNQIQTKKSPHHNQIDHKVARVRLPDVYWKTIPQTKLHPDYSAIHSNAQSLAQIDAETALFKLLFNTHDPEASVTDLLTARQRWPSTESTLALMSHDLKSEQLESARALRREFELVAQLPDKSIVEWARSALQFDQYDDALAHLQSLKSNTQETLLLKLRILVAMKSFPQAEVFLKTHQDTLLNHPEGVFLLAQIETARGLLKSALVWCKRAINMAPNQHRYYAQLVKIHLELNDFKAGLLVANEAIRLNPSAWSLYNLRGQIHYEQRKIHLAVKDWDESLILNRRQFETYARIMRAAIETGDRNTAATVFTAGRAVIPDDPRWDELENLLLKKTQ